jgi:hypothetical protein
MDLLRRRDGVREESSRGLAAGSSLREIAIGLERAVSTVSPEILLGQFPMCRGLLKCVPHRCRQLLQFE